MQDSSRYLFVRAGGRRCAVPLGAVRRVVRGLATYPVPSADRRLVGLAQFGGEPLAVVDLAALVDEVGGRHQDGVTVVLSHRRGREAGGLLGLAVDEILEVGQLPKAGDDDAGATRRAADAVHVLDPGVLLGELEAAGSGRIDREAGGE